MEFTVAAADPPGLPSILVPGDIPKGASFEAASGRFAWTPNPSQAGEFDIAFTATNSAAASSMGHVLIEVGPGRPLIRAIRNAASRAPGAAVLALLQLLSYRKLAIRARANRRRCFRGIHATGRRPRDR